MSEQISRRDFLIKTAAAGGALPFLPPITWPEKAGDMPPISIFSKHLQFLNYQDMAEIAKELGFDGIDLTVRPKGHVLPENVESDLPKAVDAMKKVGFTPSLFCTAVEDASSPIDRKVLETASKLGFKYYRMNWYKYPDQSGIPQALEGFQAKMAGLSQLNARLGLNGCYQNHAGRMVGASMFEIWDILQKTDPKNMGAQYDIRHATLEGGLSWQTGFNLIRPRIKTIVLKDFMWEKNNGKWAPKSVPLGEGMVDFATYFKLIKESGLNVPVCLHLEYPLGGADQGAFQITVDEKVVFDAMRRDLAKVKELWTQA
ncbi:TIM barrel protein [Dyadobacter sandarakinus]|uniref:TIM barrel protein n=1 Tax=Dyadobacter sandarakinus TaxID=2747268 RepID=A0ABX7I6S5_9BACT|nr:TIM barrel protein [Dyadobacter sandarakinus]QRR01802.1 TIM barrel protein [Dyadobacter sandarakinus]